MSGVINAVLLEILALWRAVMTRGGLGAALRDGSTSVCGLAGGGRTKGVLKGFCLVGSICDGVS